MIPAAKLPYEVGVFIVPMRNWNWPAAWRQLRDQLFLSYLWGIETMSTQIESHLNIPFLSYLWGIETWHLLYCLYHPLRFYRTYEELKQSWVSNWYSPIVVFIVPMRNWNQNPTPGYGASIRFLSYLWGIETWSVPIGLTGLTPFLSYLWGIETWRCRHERIWPRTFLSYLWGIETRKPAGHDRH